MDKDDGCSEPYCRKPSEISLEMPELNEPLTYCWPHYQAWERKTFPLSYEEGMP